MITFSESQRKIVDALETISDNATNICGDNRFEIIAKAKEDIISATNIEDAKDEMKCLDSFLFRCWQMGWLDKYAPYQKGGKA